MSGDPCIHEHIAGSRVITEYLSCFEYRNVGDTADVHHRSIVSILQQKTVEGGSQRCTASAKCHIFASKIRYDRYARMCGDKVGIAQLHGKGCIAFGFMPKGLSVQTDSGNLFGAHTILLHKARNRFSEQKSDPVIEGTRLSQRERMRDRMEYGRFESVWKRVGIAVFKCAGRGIDPAADDIDTVHGGAGHDTDIAFLFHRRHYNQRV